MYNNFDYVNKIRGIIMLKLIKGLFITLLVSFYLSFFVTIGYQIVVVHSALISGIKNFGQINIGIITLIIIGFLPIILWSMVSKSQIPILKETWGFRLLISEIAIVFTVCLFVSKSIFNSIAKQIISFDKSFMLNFRGRVVLIEVLSIGVPFVIFLYLSKKVYERLAKKTEE